VAAFLGEDDTVTLASFQCKYSCINSDGSILYQAASNSRNDHTCPVKPDSIAGVQRIEE
jgi:hypothetical protein